MSRKYKIKSQMECFDDNTERRIYWISNTYHWRFNLPLIIKAKRTLIQQSKALNKEGEK